MGNGQWAIALNEWQAMNLARSYRRLSGHFKGAKQPAHIGIAATNTQIHKQIDRQTNEQMNKLASQ